MKRWLIISAAIAVLGFSALAWRYVSRHGWPAARGVTVSATPVPPAGPPMRIEPAELARAGSERNDNGLKMAFCWCPPGSFHLGYADRSLARFVRAQPVAVTLRRGFWMGKYEVTQAQWEQVTGLSLRQQRAKDPKQPRPVGDGTMREHVGEGPTHPIYFVSHDDAEAFCRTLTDNERRNGRLGPGQEYRLPTDAEWEYACRAGTTTATAFGDQLSSADANFDGTAPFRGAAVGPYPRETTPVGHYRPNAWGLHDFHGNVWEWCLDGFSNTLTGGDDPVAPRTGAKRVMRGGCWHNPGSMCLSTERSFGLVDTRGSGLGFRVVLVAEGPRAAGGSRSMRESIDRRSAIADRAELRRSGLLGRVNSTNADRVNLQSAASLPEVRD